MQTRENWFETFPLKNFFHFSWQPISQNIKYDKCRSSIFHKIVVNHFEFHKEITTKTKILMNLESYCK